MTTGYKLVRADVLAWLHGEAAHPDTGLWFERPASAGAYWWRGMLRAATADTPNEGWRMVPVQATFSMHNAAAMAYQLPSIEIGESGVLRLEHSAPDWSSVWGVMLKEAPLPPQRSSE